jgi:arginase
MMNDKIDLIGMPLDLGVKELGLKIGPDALREVGLARILCQLGIDVRDRGNIPLPAIDFPAAENNHQVDMIATYCRKVAKIAAESFAEGRMPVYLGGDHSLAIASLAAASAKFGRTGCLWLDAHPDSNTPESSPSGNIHGMVLAIALGHGPQELIGMGPSRRILECEDVAIVGAQDIDPGELEFIDRHKIRMFTMFDILERGLPAVLDCALEQVTARSKRVHVSLDLDMLHRDIAPGVGLPSQCGFNVREAMYMCRRIAAGCQIASIDIVSLNPVRDVNWKTARLAVELLAALLGKQYSFDYHGYLAEQRR